jgi:ADP-dependent NAD(P)H-hydrate dehydratase
MDPASITLEEVATLPALAPRPADSNKGTFGRVLVVAGSRGMTGAAVLCGSAALRGGAGLVRVAVPAGVLPIVAAGNPCYITVPLPDDDEGRLATAAAEELVRLANDNTVVALGPGLGQSPALTFVVSAVLARSRTPLVLDADGLNVLAGRADRLRGKAGPLIITPHPGEFARLAGVDIPTVQANRRDLAARFAAEHGLIVVLKGHGTIVSDGRRVYRNSTGNPGMATAGSGDVLTGLIAALLGQGLEPFDAAQLGVWLHGRAGDLACEELGQAPLIASDLLQFLPRAFSKP